MTKPIKRCPFCGAQSCAHQYGPEGRQKYAKYGWRVECEGCGAKSDFYARQDLAIEHWNRRKQ